MLPEVDRTAEVEVAGSTKGVDQHPESPASSIEVRTGNGGWEGRNQWLRIDRDRFTPGRFGVKTHQVVENAKHRWSVDDRMVPGGQQVAPCSVRCDQNPDPQEGPRCTSNGSLVI